MNPAADALGLIAGSRSLPLELARYARAQGVKRIVAVGFPGETDPALAELVDDLIWVRVGQLSRLIAAFRERGVAHCVMAGQVAPRNLFDIRPDLRALGLLLRVKEKNAHTLFGAIADELKKDGIELLDARPWLKPLMPGVGFALGPRLSKSHWDDVGFGYRLAKEMARLEVGQTVVVKHGTVLSVEALEGTDRCLERGGELAGKSGGAMAIKVARERHDMRFDIPCLGPRTIETAARARLSGVAFEADATLLLDLESMRELASREGISVVSTNGASV
jgi:hypothetical protein